MITYGVEGLRTITVLQVCALLKLVVANLAHIVVAVRLIAMHLFKLIAEVVRTGNLLLVWINHLQPVVLGFYMEKLSKIQRKYPLALTNFKAVYSLVLLILSYVFILCFI